MLGALYAVLSAASFAFNNASLRRGVITSSVFQALAITVPIGVPLFLIACLLGGQLDWLMKFSGRNYLFLSLAGIFHFVWGRYCGYRAIKAMGSNLVAPVQSGNLVVALGLAIILLGEYMTPLKLIGLGLIIAGAGIAVPPAKKKPGAEKPGETTFKPNLTEGYTWALLSCTGYGLSPVLVRLGLEGTSGAAMAAGLVSYTAASLFFCLFLIPKGRVVDVLQMDRKALPWFINSGFFVFLAQMLRYLALSIAPVTVVTPIQRITGIFRILFSTLLNPGHEVINLRLIIGMVVSILGAVALTLSVDFIAVHIDLPRAFLEWRWPAGN
jgi:uncharacterized membrane protein